MLIIPAPDPIEGESLADELRAAGLTVDAVVLNGPKVEVYGPAEADREAVERVAADHVPPPPEPDPEDEFDADLAAAAAKPTLEEKVDALIAALQGSNGGPGAEPRRRGVGGGT